MPKATKDQQEHFELVVSGAPYSLAYTSDDYKLRVIEIDPTPRADSSGRVNGEGFAMVWSAVVDPLWTNLVGNMHGAAAAWIADTCTSAALVILHTPTFWGPPMFAGVSLNLNVDYLHPIPAEKKIKIIARVIRLTPSLANVNCEIRDFNSDKLLCAATHLKTWRPARGAKL